MKKTSDKKTSAAKKRNRKLKLLELEKKVAPAPSIGKKPAIPGPYAPGTFYGLAKRRNIT
jgi:hypothetical protein